MKLRQATDLLGLTESRTTKRTRRQWILTTAVAMIGCFLAVEVTSGAPIALIVATFALLLIVAVLDGLLSSGKK